MASGWVVADTRGGLGNRLRVLLGCLSYAQHVGARFAYVWPRRGFGARMDDLWAFDHRRLPTVIGGLTRRLVATSDEHLAGGRPHGRLRYVVTDQEIRLPPGATPWTDHLRHLRPSPQVAGPVRETWAGRLAGGPYVGVMVRAHPTAHPTTRRTSPVSWFLTRMTEVRQELGDVTVFLSCDYPPTQEAICAQVPGVVCLEKRGRFNSRLGLQEAVVDLYLLASSSYLIGPYWSSFVELAYELCGRAAALETPLGARAGPPLSLCPPAEDPLDPGRRRG